jgi:hypothetical protein
MKNAKQSTGQLDLFAGTDDYIEHPAEPTEHAQSLEADEPIDDATIWAKHTDFPPSEQALICWYFRLRNPRGRGKREPIADFDDVVRTVLLALGTLAESDNSDLRTADVTVWIGDPHSLMIGLPDDSGEAVFQHFHDHLDTVEGYEKTDPAHTSTSPMVPIYRYDNGILIAYDDPDLAGRAIVDGPDAFNTGLLLHYRAMAAIEDIDLSLFE